METKVGGPQFLPSLPPPQCRLPQCKVPRCLAAAPQIAGCLSAEARAWTRVVGLSIRSGSFLWTSRSFPRCERRDTHTINLGRSMLVDLTISTFSSLALATSCSVRCSVAYFVTIASDLSYAIQDPTKAHGTIPSASNSMCLVYRRLHFLSCILQ